MAITSVARDCCTHQIDTVIPRILYNYETLRHSERLPAEAFRQGIPLPCGRSMKSILYTNRHQRVIVFSVDIS
jgi:hypothetical protein